MDIRRQAADVPIDAARMRQDSGYALSVLLWRRQQQAKRAGEPSKAAGWQSGGGPLYPSGQLGITHGREQHDRAAWAPLSFPCRKKGARLRLCIMLGGI
jgi:hypothetical protein